jgi:hypothetical protein
VSGISAERWNVGTLFGVVFVVVGISDGQWLLVPLGVGLVVLGVWMTMQRLGSPPVSRRLAWLAIQTAVVGGGLVLALLLDGVARWVVLIAALLAAGTVATRLTGVRAVR